MLIRIGVFAFLWVVWFTLLESERKFQEPKYKSYCWATIMATMIYWLASLGVKAL